MDRSCFCVSTGACGVSVPHHFHSGGVPEGNSLWPALSPQRLPEERLESARLHHCSRRVSDQKHARRDKSYGMFFNDPVLPIVNLCSFIEGLTKSCMNAIHCLFPGFLKALPDTFLTAAHQWQINHSTLV